MSASSLPFTKTLLVLILATSSSICRSFPSSNQEGDAVRANLATFIHWAVPQPDIPSSTPADISTTPTTLLPATPTEPNLVPELVNTTTTPTPQLNNTTTPTPQLNNTTTPMSHIVLNATQTSPSTPSSTATPTESSTVVEPLVTARPDLVDSSSDVDNKETIYVIRQGPSGSVVGIIREALGLVANTIRVVGLNLSLLGGPLLLGVEPEGGSVGGGRFPTGIIRINSTHFKLVRPRLPTRRTTLQATTMTDKIKEMATSTKNATVNVHV